MARKSLTEEDVRRVVREELERARAVPIWTTPQPYPQPPTYTPPWPNNEWLSSCPNGCKVGTICGSVTCPMRVTIT